MYNENAPNGNQYMMARSPGYNSLSAKKKDKLS